MKQYLKSIIKIGICAILLATIAGVCIRQVNLGNPPAVMASNPENQVFSKTIDDYIQENNQLKQELVLAQSSADEWKSHADNLSAKLNNMTEYQEQTTIKVVEAAKPVYLNNQWREFESLDVLTEWVKDHMVTLWFAGDKVADCDDYASRLQIQAFKDGYLLSVQVINDGMLDGINVSNFTQSHMGNLAMIGNEIYFVEPQPKYFHIVFVCNRD